MIIDPIKRKKGPAEETKIKDIFAIELFQMGFAYTIISKAKNNFDTNAK